MRTFPVLWQGSRKYLETLKRLGCPRNVPWDLIESRRSFCLDNHDQTPERLAERGGLSPEEILALGAKTHAERWKMWKLPPEESVPQLLAMINNKDQK